MQHCKLIPLLSAGLEHHFVAWKYCVKDYFSRDFFLSVCLSCTQSWKLRDWAQMGIWKIWSFPRTWAMGAPFSCQQIPWSKMVEMVGLAPQATPASWGSHALGVVLCLTIISKVLIAMLIFNLTGSVICSCPWLQATLADWECITLLSDSQPSKVFCDGKNASDP